MSSNRSQRVQITLRPRQLAKLDILCQQQGYTRSAFLAQLINQEWKEDGHTESEVDGVDDG